MTFPIKITDAPLNTDILYNNKWKSTDCYLHNTDSEGYCCAFLYTVDKKITESANEALVYLLQRSIMEEEGWSEQMMAEIIPEQLACFILDCGYLHSAKGTDLSTEEFWINYNGLTTGMREHESYVLTKNGTVIPTIDLEFHEERYIISVTCFVNKWNHHQFFFETYTHWAFFRWSTGA